MRASEPPTIRGAALSVLLALALAGPLSACGGDEEAADPAAAVEQYFTALHEGDAAAVCGLISADTLADLGSPESCERLYETGFELVDERSAELPEYEVSGAEIDGESATVTVAIAGREQDVELLEEDGAWKLHGATAVSQFHPDLVPGKFP
jgi:hypothetical protein